MAKKKLRIDKLSLEVMDRVLDRIRLRQGSPSTPIYDALMSLDQSRQSTIRRMRRQIVELESRVYQLETELQERMNHGTQGSADA